MTTHGGYVDLQVNGYVGVDFNADNVTVEEFARACEALRNDGVESILATVITDSIEAMERRLRNIVTATRSDTNVANMIRGLHVEGPFLNPTPGYIGAHPAEHAKPANLDEMRRLIDAGDGLTRIVTLAPECDSGYSVTRWLSDQAIVVSGGHCDPTLDELKAAIDAGLRMFTHLGNGCPLNLHRHDNIIQRVLSLATNLHIGFIADGIHVPFHALENYLKIAGDHAFVVTDAVAAAGQGPGTYEMLGQQVVVDEHLATWAADRSHLVGSAMTMPRVCANLAAMGFDDIQIERMTRTTPLSAIGW